METPVNVYMYMCIHVYIYIYVAPPQLSTFSGEVEGSV